MVIIGKRAGQLGNRLIVFAHIIANAIENNYEVQNPSFYGYSQYFTGTRDDFFCRYPARTTRWNPVALQQLYYRIINKCVLPLCGFSRLARLLNVCILDITRKNDAEDCYDVSKSYYIDLATSTRRLIIKDAWPFRDHANLEKHADKVRTFFTPVEKHSSAVSHLISRARNDSDLLVGVHIRQGDYKRWLGGTYYFATAEYAAIMARFAATMPDKRVRFLLCSNEKQDETLFSGLNYIFGTNHQLEDMYALAHCDFLIGPPSTYTIWASFYGSVPLYTINTANDSFTSDNFQISHG